MARPAFRCFFCYPHSPWQRGTNENTGLLRQYFREATNLSRHSPRELAAVAATLNSRPGKTLGWRTPAEAYLRWYQDGADVYAKTVVRPRRSGPS